MQDWVIPDIAYMAQFILASYLLIHGLIGIKAFRNAQNFIPFSLSSISLAIVLLAPLYGKQNSIFIQTTTLLQWSFFYLFVYYQKHRFILKWLLTPGLIFPALWVLVLNLYPGYSVFFPTVYFFHLTVFLLISLRKTFILNRSKQLESTNAHHYLKWLHFGLLILILTRFLLPIAIANTDTYTRIFHLVTALYFIGISAYYLNSPQFIFPKNPMLKEVASNYEDHIKRRLEAVLKNERVYLIPDLTLQELAAKMEMKSSDLSGFFNNVLSKNFNDVINEYRVREVTNLIKDPSIDPKTTIMELAYRSGFNSKATFNRIFKKNTGVTPKEFKKTFSKN